MSAGWALVRMARPGNAWLAAAGAFTGGVLVAEAEADTASLLLAAACCLLGVGAGNILNDVRDLEIDRRAHPARPLPRRLVSPRAATAASASLSASALVLAALVNPLVLAAAAVLVGSLLVYEFYLKASGLAGNLWISAVVAATFLLGGLAASTPPLTYDGAAIDAALGAPRLIVPVIVGLLALFANTAREVFKDVEDVEGDRAFRRTLPMRIGAGRAMWTARGFLAAAVVLAVGGGVEHADFGAVLVLDGLFLLPAILLFVVALVQPAAALAQRWTKAGMAAAILGFLGIGLF